MNQQDPLNTLGNVPGNIVAIRGTANNTGDSTFALVICNDGSQSDGISGNLILSKKHSMGTLTSAGICQSG
jgi:hypothetical protein